jgi:uncharacterized protein YcaQ
VLDSIAVLQLDSVNVFCRSHYVPLFSRLGPYPRDLLDKLSAHTRGPVRRELVEYWAHMAALIPVEMYPLFRWRMDRPESWGSLDRVLRENPNLVEVLERRMAADGPMRAGETGFARPNTPGSMWNWHDGKVALEHLFYAGRVMASRRVNFERWYDLTEHVLPASVAAGAPNGEADQRRELVRIATRALGVGTVADIADYFRMAQASTKARLAELVEAGEVRPWSKGRWLGIARLPVGAGTAAPACPCPGAAVAVRFAGLDPTPGRAALRLPLPDRDLHAAAQAGVRLLRPSLPAR